MSNVINRIKEGLKKAGYSDAVIGSLTDEELLSQGANTAVKYGTITSREVREYIKQEKPGLAATEVSGDEEQDASLKQAVVGIIFNIASALGVDGPDMNLWQREWKLIMAELSTYSSQVSARIARDAKKMENMVDIPEPEIIPGRTITILNDPDEPDDLGGIQGRVEQTLIDLLVTYTAPAPGSEKLGRKINPQHTRCIVTNETGQQFVVPARRIGTL